VTDHDEIERVLAALDGGRMYVGPKDDRNVTKKAVARIIRELRAELARWKDPESPERQALQEEVILALGDGARSEIALRESQLAAAEAALFEVRRVFGDRLLAADRERYELRAELAASEREGDRMQDAMVEAEKELSALKMDHEALRADFDEYGEHGHSCRKTLYPRTGACDCGLDQARERWRTA
jgi:chromosome segregation ATPase